jgi:YbbR domain-containing protein
VSFACAIVLYSFVHGGQEARRSIVVDVEAILPPAEMNRVLVSTLPQNVRLTLRGSSQAIDDLRASALTVQLDLSAAKDGHVTFDPKMVHGSQGTKYVVEQFEPQSIDLQWESRVTRDVSLQVGVVGKPAPGLVVRGAPLVEPPQVTVRGPASEVSTLQHVRADAFDVTGLGEGRYQRTLAIERLSARLLVEPKTVTVTTEIAREMMERSFDKLPVVVVGQPKGKTTPADVAVVLSCPPEIVRSLRPEQIVPRTEVTSKEPAGSEEHPVTVALPGCEAKISPPNVIVKW